MCLSNIPLISLKQYYNTRVFNSMGYSLSNDSWVLKSEPPFGPVHDSLVYHPPKNPSSPILPDSKLVEDLLNKISSMDAKFENLQDLLMLSYYKFDVVKNSLEKIKVVNKETRTDVGKILLPLILVIKESIKVGQKIQNSTDDMSTTLTNQFENLKTALVNTISYFLCPRG